MKHVSKTSTRKLIKRLYADVDGYHLSRKDGKRIEKQKASAVYGEIKYGSMRRLLRLLRLNEEDVFYDLGSGLGKVVLQVALDTPARKTVGIEISSTRYKAATKALRKVRDRGLIEKGRCRFHNKDFFDVDLSDATVIFTCSTTFSSKTMKKLPKRLAKLEDGVMIASLQGLPKHPRLKLVYSLLLNMTWMDRCSVHVYRVTRKKQDT